MTEVIRVFSTLLRRRVADPSLWEGRVAIALAAPFEREAFLREFASVGRSLGTAPLDLDADEAAAADRAGARVALASWPIDTLGRAALLLAAAEHLSPAELQGLVECCYRYGDVAERGAVVRVLVLLPAPERFVALATDACRTSVQPLFEALACGNPYPAAYLPEPSFNQMVLKALFTGVALARIIGLDERRTPELARMAADFASERRAAGRSVPADVARLVAIQEKP